MTCYGAFYGADTARKRAPGMGLRHKGPTAPLYGAHHPNPEAFIAHGYGANYGYGARRKGMRSLAAIVQTIVSRCEP